jgi:16S rRNA processing protein RimM
MKTLTVGQIVKAFGIKGEVKVKPYGVAENFASYPAVFIKGVKFEVLMGRHSDGFAYLKLKGVEDRNAAELLVGEELEISRTDAKDLKDGEFYVADIVGCTLVLSNGKNLGVITDVSGYGAADVFTMECDGKTCRFPFIRRLNPVVDLDGKTLTVDAKVFGEVCVYED